MVTKLRKQRVPPAIEEHDQVSTRLTPHELRSIDTLVSSGFFLSRSDFVRSAIRGKLNAVRVEEIRDIPKAQAQKEILDYLDKHPGSYPSDIAAELGLDLALVMEIAQNLLMRKKVEEVDAHGHA